MQKNIAAANVARFGADFTTWFRTGVGVAEAVGIASMDRVQNVPAYGTVALSAVHGGVAMGDFVDGKLAWLAEQLGSPSEKYNSQLDDITDKAVNHVVAYASIYRIYKAGHTLTAAALAVPQTGILVRDIAMTVERFKAPDGVNVKASKKAKMKTGFLNALQTGEVSPLINFRSYRALLVASRAVGAVASIKTFKEAKESFAKQKAELELIKAA